MKQVARITDQLTPYKEDLDVSSVLGIKCARAIKPREVIPGNEDDPYAHALHSSGDLQDGRAQ